MRSRKANENVRLCDIVAAARAAGCEVKIELVPLNPWRRFLWKLSRRKCVMDLNEVTK